MSFGASSPVIVYNGEVYNFRELRAELETRGYTFTGDTDTEVLLRLYEEEGTEMAHRLRGLFAFAVYDPARDMLFAARDHFGAKPFYYAKLDGEFVFASEIKAMAGHPGFVKEVNTRALESYLTFQYSVLDESFFRGVYKLPPGHCLVYTGVSGGGEVSLKRYFEPMYAPQADMTMDDAVSQIEHAVSEAVRTNRYSSVEAGAFLSSGVDSSYVAASFGGKKTFSVGFAHEQYNEIEFAKRLSANIGAENHSKLISPDEFFGVMPKVQYALDEPLADPAVVALYFGCEAAAQHVKVVMSGEGADEFFGGYNIYREPLSLAGFAKLPLCLRRFLAAAARAVPFGFKGKNFLIRASKPVEERFVGNANIFSQAEREKILRNPHGGPSPQEVTKPIYDKAAHLDDITKMQLVDINSWLTGDILLNTDKMSMAHSLEIRMPLLDTRVFDVAARMPSHLRVGKYTKHAFRLAAKKTLPEEWASRPKLGFPVPIRIWLREDVYHAKVRQAFESEAAALYFIPGEIQRLLDDHRSGKADNSRKIWTVYTFLIWHEEFFGKE